MATPLRPALHLTRPVLLVVAGYVIGGSTSTTQPPEPLSMRLRPIALINSIDDTMYEAHLFYPDWGKRAEEDPNLVSSLLWALRSDMDAGWAFRVLQRVAPDTARFYCASQLDDRKPYKPIICRRLVCQRLPLSDRRTCESEADNAYRKFITKLAPEIENSQHGWPI